MASGDTHDGRRSKSLWLCIALILAIGLSQLPLLRLLDLKLLDQQFQWKRRFQPTQEQQVVLVGVDEESERAFTEPLALWHRHFADVFRGIAKGGARGVGLDYNLPERSFDSILPGSDAEMVRGLIALKQARIPLVIGVAVQGDFRIRPIHPLFLTVNGEKGNGAVMTYLDPDSCLRRFGQAYDQQGRPVPTLTWLLSERLQVIPSERIAEGYVDFGYGQRLDYVPFHHVVQWSREERVDELARRFKDKVVYIGSVLPFQDRHLMPVNMAAWEPDDGTPASGVLFHVQAMRSILGPGLIQEAPVWMRLTLTSLLCLGMWMLGGRTAVGLAALAAAMALLLALAYFLLDLRLFMPSVTLMLGGAIGCIIRVSLEASLKLQERWRLRRVFAGYVSPAILKDIVDGKIQPGLQGRRMPICVLFSDVRDFTTLSESLDPEALIAILNRYFSRMTEAIHKHNGTLDKFIGDGIMAFFGAPELLDNPCRNAFESARTMLEELEKLNQEFEAEGKPRLRIGIGLHFGEAAVGHVGSESRHEYTAIGDVVNVASRVEGKTKTSGCALLCTESVLERLEEYREPSGEFIFVGEQALKGHTPVALHGWSRYPL